MNLPFALGQTTKALISTAALAGSLGFATMQAHAYAIDTKIGEANLANSSDAAEIAAIEAAAGLAPGTLELDFKLDAEDAGFNFNVNPEGGWYIDVAPDTPGYFALKFGTGGTTATADTFFFQNIADLTKLVFTNEQVQFLSGGNCGANNQNACNIGRLSHYVGTASSSTSGSGSGGASTGGNVSEPSSSALALLGLGLLGVGFRARRKAARG
ncbi:MAG: PEP-CTERM sorting domain-containing protein [Pseudomonadota bacterium]